MFPHITNWAGVSFLIAAVLFAALATLITWLAENTKARHRLAVWLFDKAALIHPNITKSYGMAHHVGDHRWLEWKIVRVKPGQQSL